MLLKKTEAHRSAPFCVMARRSDEGEPVSNATVDDRVHEVEQAACCVTGRLPGVRAGRGVRVQKGFFPPFSGGDVLHIATVVDEGYFFARGFPGGDLQEIEARVHLVDHLVDYRKTFGTFRVVTPHVMQQIARISDYSSRFHR